MWGENGMPVGSSIRADTWKLWEMKSSLGFWFPYMLCWLCQRNKALTALYPAIFRAVFAGGNLKEWRNISPQDKEAACLLLPQIYRISKLTGPLLQPNPLPVQLTSGSPHHPVGLGCLGNQRKYASTLVTALSVNNEVSISDPGISSFLPASKRLQQPNLLTAKWGEGFPRWHSGKESCQCRRWGLNPWVGKIPWSRT